MKAPGNITLGKTIEQHLASKVLVPFTVVRFYGEGTPERVAGKDVYITGWYNNRSGGLTFTIRVAVGSTFADSVVDRPLTAKVGVYADQEDAKADFYGTK